MSEDLPTALQQLVDALEERGFAATSDVLYEPRRGRAMTLANDRRQTAASIRLEQDRRLWGVEIEVAGKWRSPYQILLALDGAKYATRPLSHEERLRFTLEALDRMPQTPTEIRPLVDRLEDFDREYWRRPGVKSDKH